MSLLLATHDLHVAYSGRGVLRGLELRVERGAIYGFLGRNGAGKTTTLRAALGLVHPARGEVELEGRRYRSVPAAARRRVGWLGQEQVFYEWMDARRLGAFVGAFYPGWDQALYDRLLASLRVDPRTPSGALSTGTRRKLGLALALAPRPPLLLLDEPTAGVDPVTRAELLDFLRELVRTGDHTVVFSTHYIAEVEAIATHLGVLAGGRLVYQGSPDGLRARARWVDEAPSTATVLDRGPRGALVWAEPEAWDGVPSRPATLEEAFVGLARGEPGG